MSRITKNSKDLLTWSGHLSLMPTDDTFDFFLVLCWEQFVSDSLVVLANIDVDDMVTASCIEQKGEKADSYAHTIKFALDAVEYRKLA